MCDTGTCHCQDGYITYESSVGCNYHQKSQQTIFLLSFFVGTLGADQFVLGHTDLGVGKLIFTLLPVFSVLIYCVLICRIELEGDCLEITSFILKMLWGIGVFIWWLYDVIVIGKCTVTDGNDAPLEGW